MAERICVPVKLIGTQKWADLGALGISHRIIAETISLEDAKFPASGGHRVRLLKAKKNVHFLVPDGIELDISGVEPGPAPRRKQRK